MSTASAPLMPPTGGGVGFIATRLEGVPTAVEAFFQRVWTTWFQVGPDRLGFCKERAPVSE
jgi:hypothetical protein